MPLKDWLLALCVVSLWGLNFIAVKVTMQTIPPFLLTAIRFALVAAMLAWAASNVQVKKLGDINPLALNGWMAVCAAPMLAVLSLATETGHAELPARMMADWRPWAGLAYTVIGSSLVAYTLWYGLLRRHPMNRVVPVTLLGPVVAVAGGVLILGEALTWQKLVGGAITIIGVAVVQFLGGNHQPPAEPEPGT